MSLLAAARTALADGDWSDAAELARRSLEHIESPEALDLLARASWWLSDAVTLFASRERAFKLYLDRGAIRRAALMAALLDWDYRAFRAEAVVASGWLSRARRLLEEDQGCAEFGWILLREADALLFHEPFAAARSAAAAAELGRRYDDVDLAHLALGLEGRALVAAGDVASGMQKLDEATAAVVADEFSDRSAAGVTCCHLIAACEMVRDFDRAEQWCLRVREYCQRWDHPPLFAVCRAQYAGVLLSAGEWEQAEQELSAAVVELAELRPGFLSLGDVGLAELRRQQGRLDDAAAIFERLAPASHARLGQVTSQARLGLAAIALEREQYAEAEQLARSVLRQVSRGNHTARAASLETIVLAAAAAGRGETVHEELRELEELAAGVDSEAIRASAKLAYARIAAVHGRVREARETFEEAAAGFNRAGTPYDYLRARLQLAEQLSAEEAAKPAAAEAAAVMKGARRLGALSLERRAARIAHPAGNAPRKRGSITPREREVLGHVAHGLTNRQIAAQMGVSEHTVHRHLANIFTRLGLSSRAAAVAFALREGEG